MKLLLATHLEYNLLLVFSYEFANIIVFHTNRVKRIFLAIVRLVTQLPVHMH